MFEDVWFPVMEKTLAFYDLEMQIYQYNFSFWDLLLFSIAVSCIIAFIAGVING